MSKTICGMTFDEYVEFHYKFLDLTRKIRDGEAKEKDIIPFLKEQGLEPKFAEWDTKGKEIDPVYYMGAGLQPWEEEINKNPDLMSKKAMKVMELQNAQFHGDSSVSEFIEIEGVSLEAYAHMAATLAGGGDIAGLYAQYGIRDQEHFNEVNEGFMAAMTADATGMLSVHYGNMYMKYAPEHAAAVNQSVADAMAANTQLLADNEERSEKLPKKLRKMARGGSSPEELIEYIKEAVPDADDNEELDLFLEEAGEQLAEKKKWKPLKTLLEARFKLLDPGGSMEEWIEDEMDSLK